MSKDTGGAAFPVPHSIDGNWVREPIEQFSGMTLRDYFAAKAMQSILMKSADSYLNENHHTLWSEHAYKIADAMLKERAK